MVEKVRRLIDITSEHFLARPSWGHIAWASVGDVLVRGKKVVGVVYDRSEDRDEVNLCFTDWAGILKCRRLSMGLPSRLRGEISDSVVNFGKPVYAHDMPKRVFNLAESVYGKYTGDSTQVISVFSGGGG